MSAVETLTEAHEKFNEALRLLDEGIRELRSDEEDFMADRLSSYLPGNIKPLINEDHGYLASTMCCLETEIRQLEEGYEYAEETS